MKTLAIVFTLLCVLCGQLSAAEKLKVLFIPIDDLRPELQIFTLGPK